MPTKAEVAAYKKLVKADVGPGHDARAFTCEQKNYSVVTTSYGVYISGYGSGICKFYGHFAAKTPLAAVDGCIEKALEVNRELNPAQ